MQQGAVDVLAERGLMKDEGRRSHAWRGAAPEERDLFYHESNIAYLVKVTSEIDRGLAKLEEHDLIEV
ncbi:MAG: hypothetical protein IJR14_04235 [Synergistaceae bacterium]|nr:hypothetical protein [Synergistaceae bacterium]